MQTRRDFLKLATMLSGAAAASGFVSDSIQRAYAIEPAPGSTFLDAEHIVILMQENRSFDHMLGSLRGVRGFNDPRAIRLPNGNSVFVQTDSEGAAYIPWRLDIKDTRSTWMGSLPHSRDSQIDAWNEGRHDNWLDAKRSGNSEYERVPMTMGHYTREDLPFYYTLADAFTVCDQHYCSVMSSTSPNRCYLWTGTIRDRQSVDSHVFMRNEEIDGGGMIWKTFPERLQEAGIRWKAYQNELTRSLLSGEEDAWLSNFGDNILECFAAYNVEAHPGFTFAAQRWLDESVAASKQLEAEIAIEKDPAKLAQAHIKFQAVQERTEALRVALLQSSEVRYQQLSKEQQALFQAAFVTNTGDPHYHSLTALPYDDQGTPRTMLVPRGDVLYQFRRDVESGNLPTVSWLTAPENFSDHPTSPWYGAWYVSEVMDILTKNPEVWKKTIFILTYDENDGYFDHAPSFVAADPKRPETGGASLGLNAGLEYTYAEDELIQGVPQKEARSGPIGLGFRVPMIVASPWTRGGWVNSQIFDHTSTLMFLEHFIEEKYQKTVREENISTWRRAVSGDLTSLFRPYDSEDIDLGFLSRDTFITSIEEARYKEFPSNYKRLSHEEIEQFHSKSEKLLFDSHQEVGTRPSCALPYELYTDGNLATDKTHFELRLAAGNSFHGARSAGAPFNVYLRNLKPPARDGYRSATYAVKAGDTVCARFPLSDFQAGEYIIEVYGPNGFYRSFVGGTHTPHLHVLTRYEKLNDKGSGNMIVQAKSFAPGQSIVTITDNAYCAITQKKILQHKDSSIFLLELASSHGWYDFTVTSDQSDSVIRCAGRVETGRPSISDPFMAKTI